MTTWAVIPMKPLALAKTRLMDVLSADERAALARAMLRRVLRVVCPARGLGGTVVISRDQDVLALARGQGALAVRESAASDLNHALAVGADIARRHGAQRVLLLPADLPLIGSDDVRQMLAGVRSPLDVVIAPDDHCDGTNALSVPLPLRFPLAYGAGSFHRHTQAAQQHGLAVRVVASETLALDVDTPADLTEYNRRLREGLAVPGLVELHPSQRYA